MIIGIITNRTGFLHLSLHHYINETGRQREGDKLLERTLVSTRTPDELGHAMGTACLYVTCPIKLENTKTPVKKFVI